MPVVSALNGMRFVSPNTSFGIIRKASPIVREVSKTADISPAVIVSISQAAQEAAGLTIKDASSSTLLTPFSSRDVTPELLASVQKTVLDTYNRQTALAAYSSSTVDYSTRLSLKSISKSQDSLRRYLVSPPPLSNKTENRVAAIVHAAAKSYLSLRDTSSSYESQKSYTHVDIGTTNTGNEELLSVVGDRTIFLLKQQFNLAARGLSAYDTKTLNAFLKYASSPESIRQALDKPSNDVTSLDFQFAVFVRQVAKDVVSDIVTRRGGKQVAIDKTQFDAIDKDSFMEILKKTLTEDIDSFKTSIVKSLPSAEFLKDAEMGYEFARRVIDSGLGSVIETTQKIIDDPLIDEYSGFVTLNRLVSKALTQHRIQKQSAEAEKNVDAVANTTSTSSTTRILGASSSISSMQSSKLKILAASVRKSLVIKSKI